MPETHELTKLMFQLSDTRVDLWIHLTISMHLIFFVLWIDKFLHRLWSCRSSRTILEKYLKHAVVLAGNHITTEKLSAEKRSQMHFNLAHYADALFRSHEERLNSNEWHVAIRLRKHKVCSIYDKIGKRNAQNFTLGC